MRRKHGRAQNKLGHMCVSHIVDSDVAKQHVTPPRLIAPTIFRFWPQT